MRSASGVWGASMTPQKETTSLRSNAAANSIGSGISGRQFLLAASAIAMLVAGTAEAAAQASAEAKPESQLPPINVTAPEAKRAGGTPARTAGAGAARRRQQVARQVQPEAKPKEFGPSQDAKTGTVGVYANSTPVATKSNTPIVNIPQSLSVLTKDFIRDQNFQNLTEVTRYVPGVAIHQGEGNRDELVIRGVDSSANFFVNGFRDDVQYFRDFYNAQSIEVLKGPSALTFGRGAGGGLVNRTLKEADGTRVYEASAQTGSWGDRRVTLDAGNAINENVAARLNVFYEGSDAFRDFNHLERYGINPTVTLKPDDDTKIKLSYEYFHDDRTADRGNPSLTPFGGATRFNPATPFAPNGDFSTFFGSPSLNKAIATVQTGMAIIEHDFGNGLTVRNGTIAADYKKFYQNVYPGNGPLAGAVDPAQTTFNLAAYQHTTNRDNVFNQTDFLYKTAVGPVFHTLAFGTEFGRQTGVDVRNTGIFPNGTNTIGDNPFAPTYFGPVTFIHHFTAINPDKVTTPDSNSSYRLNVESGYVRDTAEFGRMLQLIGGVRFDRFDIAATDMNTNTSRARIDDKLSPAAAVIVKPIDSLSIYTMYSVSYLPASGDQFSSLTDGTVILTPQKFVTEEVGLKYNINPKLLFSTAVYNLDRTNQPLADGNNPGFFFPSGATRVKGFEFEPDRLRQPAMADDVRLCLHGCEDRQRDLGDHRAGQPRSARALQPVRVVEQVPDRPDLVRGARHHLLLGFLRQFGRYRETAGLLAFRCGDLCDHRQELERPAHRREHLQQGLLGVRRREQQHLAGAGPHGAAEGDLQVLAIPRSELRAVLVQSEPIPL